MVAGQNDGSHRKGMEVGRQVQADVSLASSAFGQGTVQIQYLGVAVQSNWTKTTPLPDHVGNVFQGWNGTQPVAMTVGNAEAVGTVGTVGAIGLDTGGRKWWNNIQHWANRKRSPSLRKICWP